MLREAREADIPAVADVIRRAFAEYAGRLDPPSSAHGKSAERVRAELSDGGALVATQGQEIIGCVLYHRRADHLYLDRLAVLPEHRGQGLGRRLVAAVEQRAIELGLPRVRLSVRLALSENQALYERLGYHVQSYGTHPGYSEPTFVTMERAL
jgi:predicted N-acetyltransferase YhbS